MEDRRHSERKPVNLDAKIISEGKEYEGAIENISEDGLEYFMTSFVKTSSKFIPKKLVNVNFQGLSGEKLSLTCELIWFLQAAPQEEMVLLGMRIIDPPLSYKEMVRHMN